MPEFTYTELLPLGEDTTDYQPLASGGHHLTAVVREGISRRRSRACSPH